ncbi:DUF456 domain-containing protein [Halalkalicoccus jeotgali]|uniref:DUF456 domain-containing protein n=1 Tax=Halalkalicoccus jeotgali (strain DSM 18796 / CECT 7217 / JCM 14584 / KCTC 4019 / B3) TaxID=795797 RepID=D8J4H7_HALJB|nr:DUF456 domain-containing protein [Halalkalicoccus jeotgali]ADJ13539.1 hypothetical protein HacjB3_00730 [Halalkalicoccus jeotgali B3]ELY32986.1 hypothetical protein C497_18602 [Halalkalicoccus jeotgali B3]
MVELAFAVAVALLVCGVVGSLVPLVPGALLSLAGIYGYWWASGFSEPGTLFVVGATLLALVTLGFDLLSSVISAGAGGASLRTAAVAGIVGFVLLFLAGPVGTIAGVVLATFVMEFERSGDLEGSVRTAIYTTLGMLASTAMQVVLTGVLLVGFVLVAW